MRRLRALRALSGAIEAEPAKSCAPHFFYSLGVHSQGTGSRYMRAECRVLGIDVPRDGAEGSWRPATPLAAGRLGLRQGAPLERKFDK